MRSVGSAWVYLRWIYLKDQESQNVKDKEIQDYTEGRSAMWRPAFCDFRVQTVRVSLMEVPSVWLLGLHENPPADAL